MFYFAHGDTVERPLSRSLARAAWSEAATPISTTFLTYELQEGYIHNWLIAGPDSEPAEPTADTPGLTHLPAENAAFVHEGFELRWTYYKTFDDHFINLTATGDTPRPTHAWAYAQVDSPSAHEVLFILTAYGPTDLWINGQYLSGVTAAHRASASHISLPGWLKGGRNEVWLRFALPASAPFSVGGGLQIVRDGAAERLTVFLPTEVPDVAARQYYERLLEAAYLESPVDVRGTRVRLTWPTDLALSGACEIQIQDARHRIYVEQSPYVLAGLSVDAGHPARIWEGDYFVVLRAPTMSYYHGLRYQYQLPVYIVDNPYATEPYGTYAGRRLEALQDAAKRENSVFSEIARLALGTGEDLGVERMTALVEYAVKAESDPGMGGSCGPGDAAHNRRSAYCPERRAVEDLLVAAFVCDAAGTC
jgi:hypothetical protein